MCKESLIAMKYKREKRQLVLELIILIFDLMSMRFEECGIIRN